MAGHSHWAGIKHKKGRADKIRSKIFSKLSREITVAAKLGDKNHVTHHHEDSSIVILDWSLQDTSEHWKHCCQDETIRLQYSICTNYDHIVMTSCQ